MAVKPPMLKRLWVEENWAFWIHRAVHLWLSYAFGHFIWVRRHIAVPSGILIFSVLTGLSVLCVCLTFSRAVAAKTIIAIYGIALPAAWFVSMLQMGIMRTDSFVGAIFIMLTILALPVCLALCLFIGRDGRLHFRSG